MACHHVDKHSSTSETLCDQPMTNLASKEKDVEHDTGRRPLSLHSSSPSDHTTLADDTERYGDAEAALERTLTPKRAVVKVPRSERRGLFARFCLVAEVTEPTDLTNKAKWLVTLVVALAAASAPVGSGIIFPDLEQVADDLNSTPTVTNLSVALYMLSMAIFPLWWSAFSETFGRRTIYLVSFALFILFAALSAVAQSISMFIVMRMLSGGAGASVQAVGAGTIADVWEPRERGRAIGIYFCGPLLGPLCAPIVGGLLGQHWNWRATQWALVILGGLTWIMIFFCLPETLKARKDIGEVAARETTIPAECTARPPLSRSSTREVIHSKSKKYSKMARMIFIDPLEVILYLRFMPVLLTIYYASVTFGSLYVLNVSIQYTFERAPYSYRTNIIGLMYIPNSIGYIVSSVLSGRWMDYIMQREAVKANRVSENGKLIFQPEDRMRENAWLGAIMYPTALLWYGWTVEKGVLWIAPMIANFFYGFGSMIIFAMATTMLTEFMPQKSSSGVALNNLMRNIFSCAGAIAGAPVIASIGNGWLFTILGVWAFFTASVIWAMKRFGPRWREKMERELG